MITELQQERDDLREGVCSLEGALTIKERELKKSRDKHDEDKDRLQRELRTALEEVQIAQNHSKAAETERLEIKKRY